MAEADSGSLPEVDQTLDNNLHDCHSELVAQVFLCILLHRAKDEEEEGQGGSLDSLLVVMVVFGSHGQEEGADSHNVGLGVEGNAHSHTEDNLLGEGSNPVVAECGQ